MVDITGFRKRFPEFDNATDEQVQLSLDDASLEIDPTVWRSKADKGQMFLAAHLLTQSPYGQAARMEAGEGTSTYGNHYYRMQRQVASGFRVA